MLDNAMPTYNLNFEEPIDGIILSSIHATLTNYIIHVRKLTKIMSSYGTIIFQVKEIPPYTVYLFISALLPPSLEKTPLVTAGIDFPLTWCSGWDALRAYDKYPNRSQMTTRQRKILQAFINGFMQPTPLKQLQVHMTSLSRADLMAALFRDHITPNVSNEKNQISFYNVALVPIFSYPFLIFPYAVLSSIDLASHKLT
jgi:hypothetical protein